MCTPVKKRVSFLGERGLILDILLMVNVHFCSIPKRTSDLGAMVVILRRNIFVILLGAINVYQKSGYN